MAQQGLTATTPAFGFGDPDSSSLAGQGLGLRSCDVGIPSIGCVSSPPSTANNNREAPENTPNPQTPAWLSWRHEVEAAVARHPLPRRKALPGSCCTR